MAVTFNIQFRISVATKVIRLTDTSTGFTYGKGCFKVEFPNGVVRNLPDFSAPDISTAGDYIDIPCEVDASGNVVTGSYIISYAVINNLSAGQTPLVRTFDFNWVEPANGITNFSDVITPEVVFKDLTSYSPIGSFTGALTRTITGSFPSTSEVSGSSPITSTSTNTVTVVSGANYYEGDYTPTSNVSVAYTHTSNAWLTILYTRTFSKTFAIKKCPNQLELVQKINAYRVIIDAYKETNDTQFNLLSEQYDLVIALYSHLIAMHQTTTQDGSEPILRELLSILEPYTGTYTYQSTKMLTFSLAVSGANSFSISDGTNTDSIPLGTTVTFASGNAALVPIVTNNNVTYSPTFGTLINTFAQGNDSRFHNPVTIGTANGLSISTQALSLAAATTGSAGAMSASDKTKLDGIASGATANTGTVTSVALTVPAAFSVTGSPITTSGTLAITAGGTSAEYITGAGALVTLNTANVPENTNLYFTTSRARTSISLTTTGTTGAATYDNTTGVLNIPSYIGGVTSFNTRTGAIVLSSADVTTALTYTPVPNNRNLTINGVSFDLSADRSWTIASGVTSFNTRTGAITPTAGDYTTALVTEVTNLYYTDARARAAISLTTTGTSGSATYNNTTGVLNIPAYQGGVTSFNTRTGAITLTSSDVTTALTYTPYNATNPSAYIALTSLSFTAGNAGYNNTTGVITIPTNNTQLTNGSAYITLASLSFVAGSGAYNNTTGVITIPTSNSHLTNGAGYITGITSGNVTTALGFTPENAANKGIANGYASLDGGGLVPSTQLPSYVDDVLEFANLAALPATGETGKIYVALDTNKIYRWSGSAYIEVSPTVGTIWGGITGTLANQTDLQSVLDGKQANLSGTGFVKSTAGTISYDTATYYPYPTGDTTQYVGGDGSLISFPVAGQSGTIVRLVRNNTGATLTKGTVIYISGATGNNPVVSKAIATGDATSAQTFGLCQANIANNATGYVVVMGDLIGLDTSAFTEGQQLYLSGTVAGTYTATKQYAPIHLVYIGIVTRAHPTLGQIEVNIQNGYEMDELHNVSAQSPSNNDGLFYNTTTSLWEKKSIATALGFTPYNATNPNNYIALTALSFVAGSGAYNSTTGVITIPTNNTQLTNGSNYITLTSLSGSTGISYNSTTGAISSTITQYTDALARASLSFAAGSGAYNSTTGVITIPTNTTHLTNGANFIALTALSSSATGLTYTNTTGVFSLTAGYEIPTTAFIATWDTAYTNRITSLTTTGSSGASTLVSNVLNIPTYTLTGLGGVPTTRSLTINGTAYDLSADRTWTISTNPSARAEENFVATAAQTTFTITGGYVVGLVDVYVNGVRYLPSDYTATNGTTVVLAVGLLAGDAVTILNYTSSIAALPTSRNVQDFTATAAQTTFTVTNGYIVGLIDVFVNGSKLTSSEFTATNGTTFVLTVASTVGDQVQSINYTASVNGISGAGTANYVPKFTASGTIGNSNLINDASGNLGLGVTPSAWTAGGQNIEVGSAGNIIQGQASQIAVIQNATFNSGWKYSATGFASFALQTTGQHQWFTAPSGTAGAAITFTQAMTLDANGNRQLGGTTSRNISGYRFDSILASSGAYYDFYVGTTRTGEIGVESASFNIIALNSVPLRMLVGGAERMRITSAGSVGIGTSSPATPLEIRVNADSLSWGSVATLYGYLTFGTSGSFGENVAILKTPASTGIIFSPNDIERVRVSSGGNVGIGSNSPLKILHIAKGGNANGILFTDDSAGNYRNEINNSYSGSTASSNLMTFKVSNATPTGQVTVMTLNGLGNVIISGSLSKGSGSFRIDHPLKPDTHQLVHSFIEGPQADLIYRGKLTLVNGKAQANIDEVSTMTEGTFEALCREVQCFTTNENGWDLVKGKVIGNIIYIESQNPNSTDEISWMVIGERKDKHMMDTEWTDEQGKVIVEPLKA